MVKQNPFGPWLVGSVCTSFAKLCTRKKCNKVRPSIFRPWMILLMVCLLAWFHTTNQAKAWFNLVANWEYVYIAYVNDYYTVPTYYANSSYTAAGAGFVFYNVQYDYNSIFESRPAFKYASNNYYLYWTTQSSGRWVIAGQAPDNVSSYFYYVSSTASTPPRIGWQVSMGMPNAPTLTATGTPFVIAPDGGTVYLPATFRCAVKTKGGFDAISTAKIQWRATDSATWTDMAPTYVSLTWTINFDPSMTPFGHDTITTTQYAYAESMRFRLYVTDGLYENGDLAQDTTEKGTNGWIDQDVVGCIAAKSKPPKPTQ